MSILLNILGYKIDESFIEGFKKQRIVIIPHTSKLEVVILCIALFKTNNRKNICFCVTNKYMKIPILGNILSYFGAFSVIEGTGVTNSTIEFMKKHKNKSLIISPEGALSAKEWKKGFFYIAQGTSAPISVGGICFNRHIITCNINEEILITKTDEYNSRINEIKDDFINSGICPRFPGNSFPEVQLCWNANPSYLPIKNEFTFITSFITLLFYFKHNINDFDYIIFLFSFIFLSVYNK